MSNALSTQAKAQMLREAGFAQAESPTEANGEALGLDNSTSPNAFKINSSVPQNQDNNKPQMPEWNELIPFDHSEALPAFPIDVLPVAVSDYAKAISDHTETDVSMAATFALPVLATACQRGYTVEIKPDYREVLSLQTMNIAPPSDLKGALQSPITAPLEAFQREYRKIHAAEVEQKAVQLETLELTKKRLKEEIAKAAASAKVEDAKKADLLRERLNEVAEDISNFKPVYPLTLLMEDFTPEAIIKTLFEQGGSGLVSSSEGAEIIETILNGRYDSGGNIAIPLKGYSGESYRSNRISRQSCDIECLRLSMGFAVQPLVISDLFNSAKAKGRGFTARLLFCEPQSRIGERTGITPEIPTITKDRYNQLLFNILGREVHEQLTPIYLSPEAFTEWNTYFRIVDKRLRSEWEDFSDWGGKLCGSMCRIAAIIHICEHPQRPEATPINANTMKRAIAITEYYSVHAARIYMQNVSLETKNALYLWERIKSMNNSTVAKRDLTRMTQGKQGFILDESLSILIERGYIRMEHTQTGKAGRPSPRIIVNPETENIATKLTKTPSDTNFVKFFERKGSYEGHN